MFPFDRLGQSSDPKIMVPASVMEVFHMALHIPHLKSVGINALCCSVEYRIMAVCHFFHLDDSLSQRVDVYLEL